MMAGSHTIRWRGPHHVGRPIGISSYLADPSKIRGKDAELVLLVSIPIRQYDIVSCGRRDGSAGTDTCPEHATSVLQEVGERAEGRRDLPSARMV
jgi:hypothetical protein